MFTVSVDKNKLAETLRSNREKHALIYNEARDNWRATVVAALRKRADEIEAGDRINTYFELPKPVSYEKEYAKAIQMVQWATGDTIDLDENQFQQYVNDEWQWSSNFTNTTASYR